MVDLGLRAVNEPTGEPGDLVVCQLSIEAERVETGAPRSWTDRGLTASIGISGSGRRILTPAVSRRSPARQRHDGGATATPRSRPAAPPAATAAAVSDASARSTRRLDQGRGLPRHVERELAEYLRCGILTHR
jgi:hypothetical protein